MNHVLLLLAVVALTFFESAVFSKIINSPSPRRNRPNRPKPSAGNELGQIVLANVIFRHGDRAPEWPYPNDPYQDDVKYWPRGFGQLTTVGEEQHFRLGTYLRKRYSRMLPIEYNCNNTYVRSTDVDRTLVSARCNLAGLYPDIGAYDVKSGVSFQAIPIHTETLENDILLKTYDNCPRHKALLAQLKKSPEYQCVMKVTADARREVIEHTGHKEFITDIYDILLVEKLHNLPLPNWVKPYFPHPLEELHLLDNFIANSATTELQKLAAGPIIKKMVDDMLKKADNKLVPDRNLFMYSAHDNNLVNIMQALKVFNGLMVPYASAVLVELREKNWEFFVTVVLRNSTKLEDGEHLLQLPGCDVMCPLEKFEELTKPVTSKDIVADCAEEVVGVPKQDFEMPPAAIPPSWKHCFGQEGDYSEYEDSQ